MLKILTWVWYRKYGYWIEFIEKTATDSFNDPSKIRTQVLSRKIVIYL